MFKLVLALVMIFAGYCNASMTLWATGESTKVLKTDAVQSSNHFWNGSSNTISLKAAKNEYIGFQIIVKAVGSGLTGVNLTAGNFTGAGVITSGSFEIFKVLYVGTYPDPLAPFTSTQGAPFSVTAGNNQPVWIDLHIPASATAGSYSGTITVSATGETAQTITVNLDVYNFAIPATKHLRAAIPTYGYDIYSKEGWGSINSRNASTWANEIKYYQMAHNNKFDLVCEGPFKPAITFNNGTGAITAEDWTAFDSYITSLMNGTAFADGEPQATWEAPIYDSTLGGGFPKGSDFAGFVAAVKNNGTSPMSVTTHQVCSAPYAAAVKNLASVIATHFDSKGWVSKLYCYMWNNKNIYDEPIAGFYPDIREMYELIHQGSNKLKIMQIGCPDPMWSPDYVSYYGWNAGNGFLYGTGTYGSYVDIWCPPPKAYAMDYTSYDSGIAPVKLGTKNGGKESWFYQGGEPVNGDQTLNSTGLGFRTWPWIAWKYKTDGIFYWNCTNWDTADPYTTQTDTGYGAGDGIMFYPGATIGVTGPVSSIRMKQWRRGMQDYEYMWLAKQAGGNPDTIVNAILYGKQLGEKAKAGGSSPEWNLTSDNWDIAKEQIAALVSSPATGSGANPLSNVKAYPNPFRPLTASGGKAKIANLPIGTDYNIEVRNISGAVVRTLKHSDFGNLGLVEWDGKDDSGAVAARGVYFYVITGGTQTGIGKIALIR